LKKRAAPDQTGFEARPVFLVDEGAADAASACFPTSDISPLSAREVQESQMFGLRERAFPFSPMGWPQQTQSRIGIAY
jgi:hypothetical protein